MDAVEKQMLRLLAKKYGIPMEARKTAEANPLENSMWENMLDGALKALEFVAIASLDWKLTAIVKLLQSWLKDRREEKAKRQKQLMYGAGYYADQFEKQYNQPSVGGTYY